MLLYRLPAPVDRFILARYTMEIDLTAMRGNAPASWVQHFSVSGFGSIAGYGALKYNVICDIPPGKMRKNANISCLAITFEIIHKNYETR